MANTTPSFPIPSKIGPLLFSARNGKQYVPKAPTEYTFCQSTPTHGLNRREFPGAAKPAGDLNRHHKPPRHPERSAAKPKDLEHRYTCNKAATRSKPPSHPERSEAEEP
jgi:hypothetical protein